MAIEGQKDRSKFHSWDHDIGDLFTRKPHNENWKVLSLPDLYYHIIENTWVCAHVNFFTSVLYGENHIITIKCLSISVLLSFKTLAKIGEEQFTFTTNERKSFTANYYHWIKRIIIVFKKEIISSTSHYLC